MKIFTTAEDVRAAQDGLDFEVLAYLKGKGWDYTSNTPDCRWRCLREIKGVTYALGVKDALSLQSYLEAMSALS